MEDGEGEEQEERGDGGAELRAQPGAPPRRVGVRARQHDGPRGGRCGAVRCEVRCRFPSPAPAAARRRISSCLNHADACLIAVRAASPTNFTNPHRQGADLRLVRSGLPNPEPQPNTELGSVRGHLLATYWVYTRARFQKFQKTEEF